MSEWTELADVKHVLGLGWGGGQIRVCTGKTVVVTAGKQGFTGGRQVATEHTLLALLTRVSSGFAKVRLGSRVGILGTTPVRMSRQ